MKIEKAIILFLGIFLSDCAGDAKKLITKSIVVGDNKCIIQQMPEEFQAGIKGGHFDYFRVIIESKAKLTDSSHVNYVNFGMENSIRKIIKSDTIYPAFVQRVANGKKENYEYIVSFEKNLTEKSFEIFIDDHVFGIDPVTIKF